jgi:hypothetical protein
MAKLNDVMALDVVVEVLEDGTVVPHPEIYAPQLDGKTEELDQEGWTLMNGYSGQHGYSGPIMHNSEFIGGRMEQDILEQPGYYVAVPAYWYTDEDGNEYEDGGQIDMWAVAYKAKD